MRKGHRGHLDLVSSLDLVVRPGEGGKLEAVAEGWDAQGGDKVIKDCFVDGKRWLMILALFRSDTEMVCFFPEVFLDLAKLKLIVRQPSTSCSDKTVKEVGCI